MMRALAALLVFLLLLPRPAEAAARKSPAKKAPVVVLPYALFPGVPDAIGPRIAELLAQELRGREELKLVDLKAPVARADKSDPLAQARSALGKATLLAQKGHHPAAAAALEKAISLFTANPRVLDESAGRLLSDAALQLAVERLIAGDEDGGDAALAQLVRLSPDREANAADYPPAFLFELAGVRKRLLASPRGSLRVLAPPGEGEARAWVDGHPVAALPALVKELIPGEHFVRVERAGIPWGRKVMTVAGVTARVAPQPGAEGPAADLTGELLQGELSRTAVSTAARLARAAGAEAAVFGAVMKSKDGLLVRSFLCLPRGDRVLALTPLALDAELLSGVVQMVKVGDEVAANLAAPGAEPTLPLALEDTPAPAAEVAATSPAPPSPLAATATQTATLSVPSPTPSPVPAEPIRRVALPGAPVDPLPAPAREASVARLPPRSRAADEPSRALVIQRQPAPGEPEQVAARDAKPAPAPQRLQALEPDAIRTVREEPPRQSHTVLWIVAGVAIASAAAAGGYLLYQASQPPTTGNVNLTWGH